MDGADLNSRSLTQTRLGSQQWAIKLPLHGASEYLQFVSRPGYARSVSSNGLDRVVELSEGLVQCSCRIWQDVVIAW